MSVKSQLVSKASAAKAVDASRPVITRVRGFAGNHAVMRRQSETRGRTDQRVPSEGHRQLQRKCACGSFGGQCEACKEHKAAKPQRLVQMKLAVSEAGDRYEQEADRIADQVLAAATHRPVSGAPPRLQRFIGPSTDCAGTVPASVDRVLSRPGRRLDPALQQDMEKRFGRDFSSVRVHSGAVAEQSAREVNAHAYTVGQNIVFGANRYHSGTHEGRRLIAHELTHVVQQSKSDGILDSQGNGRRGSDTNSGAGISQHTPAPLLSRQPASNEMPKTDLKTLEDCSRTHRDRDLDVRAEKYKKDYACIYGIVKRTVGKGLEGEADKLIQWASINQFMPGDMLRSMYSAAATTDPLDRLGAGTVFAIVSAGGFSGLMNNIRDGQLKVLVVHNEAFNKTAEPILGEQRAKRIRGLYVPAKDVLLLRAETMSIDDPGFRGLVIHELTHFIDDAALAGGSQLDAERHAHLEEALYLLREVKDDEKALDSVAQDTVDNPRPYLLTAALIQTKRLKHFDSTCKKLIERVSDFAKQKGQKGLASFETLISISISNLEKLMDKQMKDAGYTDEPANYDGLTK